MIATLASAGVVEVAHAQTRSPARPGVVAGQTDPNAWGGAPRRSLQFNTDGRWGLKLDFDQPTTREAEWKDVEAGAFFRLTPQLRVGGSVGLGDEGRPDPKRASAVEERPQPRVRLETTFRF